MWHCQLFRSTHTTHISDTSSSFELLLFHPTTLHAYNLYCTELDWAGHILQTHSSSSHPVHSCWRVTLPRLICLPAISKIINNTLQHFLICTGHFSKVHWALLDWTAHILQTHSSSSPLLLTRNTPSLDLFTSDIKRSSKKCTCPGSEIYTKTKKNHFDTHTYTFCPKIGSVSY